MNLTYASAAAHAKCSPSLIARLVSEGKLTKGPKRGRRATVTVPDVAKLYESVKTLAPKSGWKKRTAPKARPSAKPPRPSGELSNRLSALLAFTEIPLDKRPILVELANRFSAVELRLLLKLR